MDHRLEKDIGIQYVPTTFGMIPLSVLTGKWPRIDDYDEALKLFKFYGLVLEFASKELKKNRKVVETAVTNNGLALEHADPSLQHDKNIVVTALKQNPSAIKFVPDPSEFVNYFEIILDVVSSNLQILELVDKELLCDPKFMLEAVKKNGLALKFASEDLTKDKNIVFTAISKNYEATKFASDEVWIDEDFAYRVVMKNPNAMAYLPKNIRTNKTLILKSLCFNTTCVFSCSDLTNDRDFVLEAIKKYPYIYMQISKVLQKDFDVVLAMVTADGKMLGFVWNVPAASFLLTNKQIMMAAVTQNPEAIKYTEFNLKDYESFVFVENFLESFPNAYQHAPFNIRNELAFVMKVVILLPSSFAYASRRIRGRQDIVMEVAEINSNIACSCATSRARRKSLVKALVKDKNKR